MSPAANSLGSASADEAMMRRALELAERGRGNVEPNPVVGAVLAREGQIIAEGWHQRYGEAHAEVNAVAAAGPAARTATLYVTLEPCCHHGKTPPCTDAIIQAGIARVVVALVDPFPQVAGRGIGRLMAAGIPVEVGLCAQQARRQQAPYLKLVTTGRPYVHAKWAMTLDGKTATRRGDSKWISNETSRRKVHELRGRMDGILIGIGTALVDDPLLTARPPGPRVATRVLLDSKARLPLGSQLVRTAATAPTLIVVSATAPEDRMEALRQAGCEVVMPTTEHEPTSRLHALLDELGRRRWTNLFVEGGSEVLGRFLDAQAIDEVHAFVAPRLLGGGQGKTPIGGRGAEMLADACNLAGWETSILDGDVYVRGWKE